MVGLVAGSSRCDSKSPFDGERCIICVIADSGMCHILTVGLCPHDNSGCASTASERNQSPQPLPQPPASSQKKAAREETVWRLDLVQRQRLPANVKWSVLSDVDADGRAELVLALTDRVVRVYRFYWCSNSPSTDGANDTGEAGTLLLRAVSKCELMQQIGGIATVLRSPCYRSGASVLVAQPAASVVCLHFSASANCSSSFSSDDTTDSDSLSVRCVDGVSEEAAVNEADEASVDQDHFLPALSDSASCELVCVPHRCTEVKTSTAHSPQQTTQSTSPTRLSNEPSQNESHPPTGDGDHNERTFHVSDHLLLNRDRDVHVNQQACSGDTRELYCALATTHGQIIALDRLGRETWRRSLHHQLFCLHWIPLAGLPANVNEDDGRLVVSAWDGVTHMVCRDGSAVRYVLGESVLAFRAGVMTVCGPRQTGAGSCRDSLSFAYVTASGRLLVYHDVAIAEATVDTAVGRLRNTASWASQVQPSLVRKLCSEILYGPHSLGQLRFRSSSPQQDDRSEVHP